MTRPFRTWKRHTLILYAAFCLAAFLLLTQEKETNTRSLEKVVISRTTTPTRTALPKAPVVPDIIALIPRTELLSGVIAPDEKNGLFQSQTWMPPAPPNPPPVKIIEEPPPSPPPPMAPPLPFSFLGKQRTGETWEVFLSDGQRTYVVRDETVINNMYRVDSIRPPTLSMTYLPLKQAQTLVVGGFE